LQQLKGKAQKSLDFYSKVSLDEKFKGYFIKLPNQDERNSHLMKLKYIMKWPQLKTAYGYVREYCESKHAALEEYQELLRQQQNNIQFLQIAKESNDNDTTYANNVSNFIKANAPQNF